MVRLLHIIFSFLFCCSLHSQVVVPIQNLEFDSYGKALITVESQPENYYVLYHKESDEAEFTYPIDMRLGEAGTTELLDNLSAAEIDQYQVITFPIDAPGDVDGDGESDISEFQQLGQRSPFNPAPAVDINDGLSYIADTAVMEELSFLRDIDILGARLNELQTVKFYVLDGDKDLPRLYFLNSKVNISHADFASSTQIELSGQILTGQISFHPDILSTNGTLGAYRFRFQPSDIFPFEDVRKVQKLLATHLRFINNNLCFYPLPANLDLVAAEQASYDASRVCLLYENDLYGDIDYLPLNLTEGYGILRILEEGETPFATDIILLSAIPNELSRVGGIITTVPQTPLAHVNLRAIQDQVPNAFIRNALEIDSITNLIGNYVYFNVTGADFTLLPSTKEEVDAHFESLRPKQTQSPPRNLEQREIKPLDDIFFGEAEAYGVKTTNVATMRDFGFPSGTIPNGYGIPFYYYDAFMEFNGFYELVNNQLNDETFINNIPAQEEWLSNFRSVIRDADMPEWMWNNLRDLQESFPVGTSIRCRSSSNNEDLPGFSGAGLYDSKTQHPDEGHISKSVKQVFASTWNFRAFREREFHRIDHMTTAMGILCHPNFQEETVNGVAVSLDPLNGTINNYYVNSQKGEDLVTNPEASSIPEELLMDSEDDDKAPIILRLSNLNDGKQLLSDDERRQLRSFLNTIHNEFLDLYRPSKEEGFAMEIEFKITAEGQLFIKQARPWAGFWTSLQQQQEEEEPEPDPEFDLLLSPNPTQSFIDVNLNLAQDGPLEYTIYNMSGQRVINPISREFTRGRHTLRITEIGNLNSGLYNFVVNWEGELIVAKFIKLN